MSRLAVTLRGRSFPVLVATVTVGLCYLIVWPLAGTIVRLVRGELGTSRAGGLIGAITSSETLIALRNTTLVVGVAGAIALCVGALFAWLNERTDARIGWLAEILPLISMFVPALASTVGWVFLAEPKVGVLNNLLRNAAAAVGVTITEGPLNIYSWYGLIFAYAVFLTPFAYLSIMSGFQSLDPSLEEAARTCNAGPWRTFRTVTFPSLRPAIGGAILVLVTMGFAMFSVPVIIGTRADIDILPVLIVHDVTQAYPVDFTSAVGRSGLLLVIVLAAWYVQRRLVGGEEQAYATIGGKASRASVVSLGRLRWPARMLMYAYLAVAAVIPFLGLLAVSLQRFWSPTLDPAALTFANYQRLMQRDEVRQGLQNSLTYGLLCATAVVVAAFFLTHVTELRGGRLGRTVDGIVKIPAAVTHIVIAIALILTFGGPPFGWAGTALILLAGYVVMYFPQASFYTTAAMQQIGRPLIEASVMSGAGPGRTARRILWPLMLPSMLAGWALIFVLMFGDVTGSAMLASPRSPVVGFVMLDKWTTGTFPQIAALGVVMTLVSTVVVIAALQVRDRFRIDR